MRWRRARRARSQDEVPAWVLRALESPSFFVDDSQGFRGGAWELDPTLEPGPVTVRYKREKDRILTELAAQARAEQARPRPRGWLRRRSRPSRSW